MRIIRIFPQESARPMSPGPNDVAWLLSVFMPGFRSSPRDVCESTRSTSAAARGDSFLAALHLADQFGTCRASGLARRAVRRSNPLRAYAMACSQSVQPPTPRCFFSNSCTRLPVAWLGVRYACVRKGRTSGARGFSPPGSLRPTEPRSCGFTSRAYRSASKFRPHWARVSGRPHVQSANSQLGGDSER